MGPLPLCFADPQGCFADPQGCFADPQGCFADPQGCFADQKINECSVRKIYNRRTIEYFRRGH